MGDSDDAATRIEEVPAFARDATEEQREDDGDVFSDSDSGAEDEAVAAPAPEQTDVGGLPTELRPMDPADVEQLREELDDTEAPSEPVDDDTDESDKTRADPVESISLGSLEEGEDDGDVFSD